MKIKRILFVITGLDTGGAETQTVRIIEVLAGRGCEVMVLTLLDPVCYVDRLEKIGVEWTSLGMERGVPRFQDLLAAVKNIRHWQPEVQINISYHAIILGRLAGRIAGGHPIISSIRNAKQERWSRYVALALTAYFDTKTSTNSAMAMQSYVKNHIVPSSKMVLTPNGLDLNYFSPSTPDLIDETRKSLGISKKTFFWIAMGRLDVQKDYPNLLKAFSLLGDPAQHLVVLGKGPLLLELEELCRNLGISTQVTWLGTTQDVATYLQAADALVLSSGWEGTPNAVIEAQACGVPVVATDVGGVKEVVADGETGIVVPPGDFNRLSEGMASMVALSTEEREKFGELGRVGIVGKYNLERSVDRWLEIIGEAS